jgi:predicted ATP-grasp superfamily ATP-dependent carboligase
MSDDPIMKSKAENVFSVLIPDGESWLAYSVQSCLANIPGVKISVLSNNAWDPMRFSRYTEQFFSYPQADDEAKLAAIHDTAQRANIDIVLPVDTQTIRLLSAHNESSFLNAAISLVPKLDAMDIAANKWLLAQWLQAHHIPCPVTILCRPDLAFEQELAALRFPVLLKPIQQIGDDIGVGGRGIHIFEQPAALLEFYQQNTHIEYIVQSFINGYDMGCNVLCRAGKIEAYSIQKGFMASHIRFAPAAGIDFIENTGAYAVVSELVAKLKWTGVANFDLRYDEDDQQVKVIEINPRFWGSLLGSFCAGVNFPYLSCLAGLGLDIPEAVFHPMRYVNTGTAAKLLCQGVMHSKSQAYYFDNSALEFVIRDPLPKAWGFVTKAYAKILTQ